MSPKCALYVALVAGVLAIAKPIQAQPPKAGDSTSADKASQSRELFRKGLAAYEGGQLNEAHQLFQQVWDIQPSSDVAMELAQTEIDLGQFALAAEHLDYAIHNFTPSINDKMRNIAKQAFADTLKRVGKLHIVMNQDAAEIFVRGRSVGTSPLKKDVYIDPGPCSVEARFESSHDKQEVLAEVGKETTVALALRAAPSSSQPAAAAAPVAAAPIESPSEAAIPVENAKRSVVPVVIGGALFVVGAATAIGFKLDESSADSAADRARKTVGPAGCGPGSPTSGECSTIADSAKTHDRDVKFQVAGLVLAGTAAVATSLYWFWPRAPLTSKTGSSHIDIHGALGQKSGLAYISGTF
jgi:hypothetical protein